MLFSKDLRSFLIAATWLALGSVTLFLLGCGGGSKDENAPNQDDSYSAEQAAVRYTKTNPGCLACHSLIEESHANVKIACTDCHGGDYMATTQEAAHVHTDGTVVYDDSVPPIDKDLAYQQFVNPSNLRVADKTCGRCHEAHIDDVKKSLMSTTAGHHSGGLYQAGIDSSKTPTYATLARSDDDGVVPEEAGAVQHFSDLISWDNSLDHADASDPRLYDYKEHFKAIPEQACVRCHLWTRGKGHRGAAEDDSRDGLYRADGCAACHMVYDNDGLSRSADTSINHKEKGHPKTHQLTSKIPSEQCTHCHHRGARIGLNFSGRTQMPPDIPGGPGVLGTTDVRFNGNYHYADPETNPRDVHGEKGLHCIDCHTQAGVMGDGNMYGHQDQATKIECRTCHGLPGQEPSLTDSDGKPLKHIRRVGADLILTSKVDGREHKIPKLNDITNPSSPSYSAKAALAMNDDHLKQEGGLECFACHAAWMPNCFGCHMEHDQTKDGKNLLTGEIEDWKASTNNKMFVALRHFAMGVNSQRKISPFVVGCHPMADVTMDDGTPGGKKLLDFAMPETVNGKSGLAHNPTHPHTIRGAGEVRQCAECHRSPPSLGFGSGNYNFATKHVYLASDRGVQIYERWQQPEKPVLLQTLAGPAAPVAIAVQPNIVNGDADYLFVAYGSAGVWVYDLRDSINVDPIAKIANINAIDLHYSAQQLYMVVGGQGIRIYDVAQPTNPRQMAKLDIANAQRARLWGIDLFVAAGADGLVVVDVADAQRPRMSGQLAGMHAVDVHLYAHFQQDNQFAARAYVADSNYGVRIVNLLPDFSAPSLVGGLPIEGGAYGLDTYTRYAVDGAKSPSREHDYLYVAAGEDGLHIFDITEPDRIGAPLRRVSMSSLAGQAFDVDVVSHPAPPGMLDLAYVATDTGLALLKVGHDQSVAPNNPQVVFQAGQRFATQRVLVDVQALDRFVDEYGRELKENSHPGASPLDRDKIVRILRTEIGSEQAPKSANGSK